MDIGKPLALNALEVRLRYLGLVNEQELWKMRLQFCIVAYHRNVGESTQKLPLRDVPC